MWAVTLLSFATLSYAFVPALNYYSHGWEYPLLLNGLVRLVFSVGMLTLLAILYRPMLSRKGAMAAKRAIKENPKASLLALLTTGDVLLFSLSYRYVDISVATAITAVTPALNVIVLSLLTFGWVNRSQASGLMVAIVGVGLVMWAEGGTIALGGEWWRIVAGSVLALGAAVCGGLTVAALRLGEALAIEWYWEGLGTGPGMVWCGSMLTLALAQGIPAPVFLVLAVPLGLPSLADLGLMVLTGLAVLLGTALWALANGGGLHPVVNGLGYLQPGWAVLLLVSLGISTGVNLALLGLGLLLIVGANAALQLWGTHRA